MGKISPYKPLRVAFDFDGVINRLPKPFEIFMRYAAPNDLLMRSKLGFIKGIILNIIAYLPLVIDGKLVDMLPRNIIIVSGRYQRVDEIENKLSKLGFKNIYFRKTHSIHETVFKIRKCKDLNVDIFVDDRIYVINRLSMNGINGVDIREWAKP